jgi:hypothetical protein
MPTQKGGAFWNGNYETESGVSSGVLSYLMYILLFIIIIIAVLVVVHFTLTPIFKTTPGAKGYIPLPGSDDSAKFWPVFQQNLPIIDEVEEGLGLPSSNYTYMLDINIDDPTVNPYPGKPRILFSRANAAPNHELPYSATSSVVNLFPSTTSINTIVYLDKLTNDLNIAVFSSGNSPSTIQLPNVPIRTAFRLAVVIGDSFVEAYVNGKLVKTVTLIGPPLTLENGKLIPPPPEFMNQTARVMNLRLWGRPLTPAEIRGYGGELPKFTQGPLSVNTPGSCGA